MSPQRALGEADEMRPLSGKGPEQIPIPTTTLEASARLKKVLFPNKQKQIFSSALLLSLIEMVKKKKILASFFSFSFRYVVENVVLLTFGRKYDTL